MGEHGAQSMVAPLCRVLTSPPSAAMATADPEAWHYASALDGETLVQNHGALERILAQETHSQSDGNDRYGEDKEHYNGCDDPAEQQTEFCPHDIQWM